MVIQEGIASIDLVYHFKTRDFFTSAALLWDDKDVILCDTGLPGQLSQIKDGMAAAGVPFERLTKIIISHQDVDHIGCLHVITGLLPQVEVYAPAAEKANITGEEPFLRPLEHTTVNVPDAALGDFENLNAKVDHTLADGDYLPFCGGIQVIGTPGHSPGQISLFHIPTRTLIPNDALASMLGNLVLPFNTSDQNAAKASVKKFADIDFTQVLFYHGGLLLENAKQKVQAFIDTF